MSKVNFLIQLFIGIIKKIMTNEELIKEWNRYLIGAWFCDKGIQIIGLIHRFNISHNNSDIASIIEKPQFYRDFYTNVVFSHMALYYPRINNFLLDTKSTDKARIEKIIDVFNQTRLTEPKSSTKWLDKARRDSKRDERKADAETTTHSLISNQRLKEGGHDWKTVK